MSTIPRLQEKDGTRVSASFDAVRSKLQDVRRRVLQTRLRYSLLQLLLIGVAALVLVGAVDFYLPLSTAIRASVLLALVASLGYTYWQRRRSIRSLDERGTAIEIEAAYPALGQRLRTAEQYASGPSVIQPPRLVDALLEDTSHRTRSVDFTAAVPTTQARRMKWAVAGATALVLAIAVFIPETITTAGRLLLAPWHYTTVVLAEHTEPVARGTDVTFEADVQGRPIEHAELWVRTAGKDGTWQRHRMLPDGASEEEVPAEVRGRLLAKLKNCTEDLEYKFVGGPADSPVYTLRVLQPLEQQSFTTHIEPPAYTGLEPETVEKQDVTVVEGSAVRWELKLSRAPATARLVSRARSSADSEQTAAAELPPLSIDGTMIRCDLGRLISSTDLEIIAEATDGMKFRSAPVHFRVKKDQPPVARFARPEEQIEATPTTEVTLALNVSDDYGLSRVGIEYQIGDGPKQLLWEQDVRERKDALQAQPVLYLEEHELRLDDAITYYAFAEDNRDEPERAYSKLQFVDIRPYKREYQIVDGQCSGGGGSCLSLEELIARQRQNLGQTFAHAEDDPVADRLAARLATYQDEIREATGEFAAAWQAQFGEIPSLDRAVEAMHEAVTLLQAGNLSAALLQEQRAMTALVEARRNLRNFIKNCSGSQLAQCQQFDNQMSQKLRPPEKTEDESTQEQAAAPLQQQVRKLAAEQRKWSQQVASAPNRGAQLERPDQLEQRPQEPSPSQSAANEPPQGVKPQPSQQPQQGQLAAAQQASAAAAEQLQTSMRRAAGTSELSQQRMDQIAEAIRESLRELERDEQAAAARAERAAQMLDDLAEHLAGLQAADIAERLGIAQQMASRLAAGEESVGRRLEQPQEGPQSEAATADLADEQEHLAEHAATLADLIRHLEGDAFADGQPIARPLESLQEVQRPETLATEMHSAADDLRVGEQQRAAHTITAAAQRLDDIAQALQQIQRELVQPRLDELLAAEAEAAELLELADNAADDPRAQAELAAQMPALRRRLAALGVRLGEGNQNEGGSGATTDSNTPTRDPEFAAHFDRPHIAPPGELREAIEILQTKIQNAILLTSRMDADEPVPPKYLRIVEEYYQSLSDDLR